MFFLKCFFCPQELSKKKLEFLSVNKKIPIVRSYKDDLGLIRPLCLTYCQLFFLEIVRQCDILWGRGDLKFETNVMRFRIIVMF